MGSYYTCGGSRRDVIAELIAEQQRPEGGYFKTLRHSCAGNVLWTVHEWGAREVEPKLFIGCYLLLPHKDGWGYKPMDESMHPYYYSCPLAYLRMVETECAKWRRGVLEYWHERAKRLARRKAFRAMKGVRR